MKKIVLEQLRNHSSIPGKERTWISILSDDQLFEIFTRLRNGESCKSIAYTVKEVWQINTGSKTHSIAQGINKYKKRIAHLLIPIPDITGNQPLCTLCTGAINDENAVETLEEIARQHEKRIKRIMQEEKDTGTNYPFISRDLQSLASLRKIIIRQREWEIKHGDTMKKGNIKEIQKNIKTKFDKLMEGISEEGGERIIAVANRFLELAAEHSILIGTDLEN